MLLQLNNIFKWVNSAGQRVFLLKDINLTVEEGEFISVMGPSGSGKSTLLNVIGMLDNFDEGEYNFMDEPVHTLKEKQRSNLYKQYIGFVFQSYHLLDDLTVQENLEMPLLYKKVGRSGGQQQLVGVARALISSPRLILADEPTGNLNSKQGEEIMELFKQLNNEGVTIIQVTHSEKNATYGSRIINLLDGRQIKE